MDQPLPLTESGAIRGLVPPEELKPPEEFKKILGEYRRWINTNHDKSFDAFLAFQEAARHKEESTWEIRGELRRRGDRPHEDRRRNALKWNLILHLAHEIQEEASQAEDLLKTLKERDSPLKGLIDEPELPGPLSDLPEGEGLLRLSQTSMSQVLEAWFALFEGHLSGEDILLTLSPGVFQYLCDTWEEWGEGSAAGTALKDAVVLRQFPLLEKSPVNVIARHLSGKTIGRIRDEYLYGK